MYRYIYINLFQVGLLASDIYAGELPSVQQARKRLTDEQTQLYFFRVNRALLLSSNKQVGVIYFFTGVRLGFTIFIEIIYNKYILALS